MPPSFAQNFSGLGADGELSHCKMNCSASGPFSEAQMIESGISLSSVGPKASTAAELARRIAPELLTRSTGQPAFSKPRATSDFIKISRLAAYNLTHDS